MKKADPKDMPPPTFIMPGDDPALDEVLDRLRQDGDDGDPLYVNYRRRRAAAGPSPWVKGAAVARPIGPIDGQVLPSATRPVAGVAAMVVAPQASLAATTGAAVSPRIIAKMVMLTLAVAALLVVVALALPWSLGWRKPAPVSSSSTATDAGRSGGTLATATTPPPALPAEAMVPALPAVILKAIAEPRATGGVATSAIASSSPRGSSRTTHPEMNPRAPAPAVPPVTRAQAAPSVVPSVSTTADSTPPKPEAID